MFPDDRPQRRVLTVRQLNEEISAAMNEAFPRTIWVRGEVQRLPSDAARRTHIYFELHETGGSGAAEYQASVSLMGWDRQKFGLGRYLDGSDPDFQLANQLEVCLECRVDFYAKFGKLSLKVVGVDPSFSLGKLEARRRQTLATLAEKGLLETQSALYLPDLPLRVGLITAGGSAAEQDFRTGLDASPWAFVVEMRSARMQGESLQVEVIAALEALLKKDLDVIVITRGGGSRADLSWFDQLELSERIALSPVPVITAIGHEIDRSIADQVAHHACKTPTAAAEFLADRVEEAAYRLEQAARAVGERASELMAAAHRRIELGDRLRRAAEARLLRARYQAQGMAGRLQQKAGGEVARGREKLTGLGIQLGAAAGTRTAQALAQSRDHSRRLKAGALARIDLDRKNCDDLARRIEREGPRLTSESKRKLEGLAVQARLLDPGRLLARGFSMTLGPDGKLLKQPGQVAAGDRITTRLAEGKLESVVQSGPGTAAAGGSKSGKGKRSGGKEKDSSQKTLFR